MKWTHVYALALCEFECVLIFNSINNTGLLLFFCNDEGMTITWLCVCVYVCSQIIQWQLFPEQSPVLWARRCAVVWTREGQARNSCLNWSLHPSPASSLSSWISVLWADLSIGWTSTHVINIPTAGANTSSPSLSLSAHIQQYSGSRVWDARQSGWTGLNQT